MFPPVPESVAAAQPILYILAVLLVAVIIAFIGIIRWLMTKYVESLTKVVDKVVLQNEEQLNLLRDIKETVTELQPVAQGKRRRL